MLAGLENGVHDGVLSPGSGVWLLDSWAYHRQHMRVVHLGAGACVSLGNNWADSMLPVLGWNV